MQPKKQVSKVNQTVVSGKESANQNSALNYALAYIKLGWSVLPLKRGKKFPDKDFKVLATKELEKAKFAWKNPASGIGLWPAKSGLLVLDVDVKNGASGLLDIELLEQKYEPLPDTLRAKTPSGGLHIVFATSQEFGNEKLRAGIDVRSANGFVACEGTQLEDGKGYAWIDWDPLAGNMPAIAPAPSWLLNELKAISDNGSQRHSSADVINNDQESIAKKLQQRFSDFLTQNRKAKDRWEGSTNGLNDHSGSARDMSMVTYLKSAGFNVSEIRGLLESWPFGSATKDRLDDRYWQRCWDNSNAESPIEKRELAKKTYDQFKRLIEENDDEVYLMIELAAEISTDKTMPAAMVKLLRKQIARKTGTSVAALEIDAEEYENVAASKDKEHLKAAQEVVKSFGDGNLLACESGTWKWCQRGLWVKVTDRELKSRIHAVASSAELTSSIVSSIVDLIKTEVYLTQHYFNVGVEDQISVENGVLSYENGSWLLSQHCREDYRTTLIPVPYDPEARAPRFEQFLHEIFDAKPDKDQRIRVIKQALGYTLVPSCHLERFIMLIGAGANGKSVLLSVLAAMVGREQVCAVQPSQFENRFQRAHLEGKLANIVTEIAEGAEINDAQLKGLVSGELTTAEHKFQPPFDFRPIATHWFGTNHLPHTRDFSDALFRRAILIEFPRVFQEHERDPSLTRKLLLELPGILNIALEGIADLIESKQFGVPVSSRELAHDWRLTADQVQQFVEDCCECIPAAQIEVSLIYKKFKAWAQDSGIDRPLTKKSFSSRLARLGFHLSRTNKHRLINGLRLM